MKKKVCLLVLLCLVSSSLAKKSSAVAPNNGGGAGYSQPIPYNGVGVAGNQQAPQQQAYQYSQPMSASASTQTDYYQPMDNGYVGPPYGKKILSLCSQKKKNLNFMRKFNIMA
jgi:hypothetical protein